MTVKYDLMVANGTYQKDGQDKLNWLKIGRVMTTQKGGESGKIFIGRYSIGPLQQSN